MEYIGKEGSQAALTGLLTSRGVEKTLKKLMVIHVCRVKTGSWGAITKTTGQERSEVGPQKKNGKERNYFGRALKVRGREGKDAPSGRHCAGIV